MQRLKLKFELEAVGGVHEIWCGVLRGVQPLDPSHFKLKMGNKMGFNLLMTLKSFIA